MPPRTRTWPWLRSIRVPPYLLVRSDTNSAFGGADPSLHGLARLGDGVQASLIGNVVAVLLSLSGCASERPFYLATAHCGTRLEQCSIDWLCLPFQGPVSSPRCSTNIRAAAFRSSLIKHSDADMLIRRPSLRPRSRRRAVSRA